MMVQIPLLTVFVASFPCTFAQTCATIAPAFAPTWATGFSGRVLMNGLNSPRGLVFDSANNLLIVESGGAGVRWVNLTDNGGTDVCVDTSKQIINDQTASNGSTRSKLNHGIDLSVDGKTLFVSSTSSVYSYPYDAATGTVGAQKTLITGMGSTGHSTRTVLTSKKRSDVLFVSVGSNANIDPATRQKSSGRSQIRAFSIPGLEQASVPFTAGEVLGWGLRNSVGLTENPVTGGIWSVENSVDDLTKDNVDIHNTNPCEELNYHGNLVVASPETGANYGYPDCFTAWDPSVIPNNQNITVGTQFANGTENDSICADRMPPKLCFPAHTAPLGIRFNNNSTAAYIAFHGSWDRSPPDGYRLSKILMDPTTGMPIEPSTSTEAAINIMINPDDTVCPGKCFRPVGVAFDNGGRLFMTSDATNEVWVIGGSL